MMHERPLSDCTVLVTRPSEEAGATARALADAGARVIECPAIEFASLVEQNVGPIKEILRALGERAGWLVLPSPTAVRYFGEVLSRLHLEPADLGDLRIATIGPGSAAALGELGLAAAFQPPLEQGASLAEHLPAEPGCPVVILGSRQTRPELRDGLAGRGLMAQTLPLYAPRPSREGLDRLRRTLRGEGEIASPGAVRMLLVTSPSAVDAIGEALADAPELLERVGWLAIGPTTLRRVHERGIGENLTAQAGQPRPESIARAAAGLAAALRRTATEAG
jgi:uroporphyrinogen III methyltransferase/synthase